jgi:hypothetical protein
MKQIRYHIESGLSIVTFQEDLVAKALSQQDYSDFPSELCPGNPGIVAGAYIKNVIDPFNDKIRPATKQDLMEYTKLCESSCTRHPMNTVVFMLMEFSM